MISQAREMAPIYFLPLMWGYLTRGRYLRHHFLIIITILTLKTPWKVVGRPEPRKYLVFLPFNKYVRNEVSSHRSKVTTDTNTISLPKMVSLTIMPTNKVKNSTPIHLIESTCILSTKKSKTANLTAG